MTLQIFVGAKDSNARRAHQFLEQALSDLKNTSITIEVIEVAQSPDLIEENRILATPTILKAGDPKKRIIGHINSLESARKALDYFMIAYETE